MGQITKLVIFDFDGTCTDVEEEGKGYIEALIDTLARITGEARNVIAARYEEGEKWLRREASETAWMMNGLPVAPALVDPYLRSKPISRRILERCGVTGTVLELRVEELSGPLYKQHYAKSGIALREHLREVLEVLHDDPRMAFAFVTNSDQEAVQQKLDTLDLNWQPRVVGGAKKYIAESGLESWLPGLNRGILLHRPHYRTVLEALMREHDVKENRVTVIGDIYELDLALPDHLGMRIAQMIGPNTPTYEIEYMQTSDHHRRAVVRNLGEALGFILTA